MAIYNDPSFLNFQIQTFHLKSSELSKITKLNAFNLPNIIPQKTYDIDYNGKNLDSNEHINQKDNKFGLYILNQNINRFSRYSVDINQNHNINSNINRINSVDCNSHGHDLNRNIEHVGATNADRVDNNRIKILLFGAIAGATAKTVIAPLDRAKILVQISKDQFSFRKLYHVLSNTVSQNGWRALWRGNTATITRVVPYAAIQYLSHEEAKLFLRPENYPKDAPLPPFKRLVAGCFAGSMSVLLTYPLDIMRARMAITNYQKYKNIIHTGRVMARDEGLKTFYRGITPTLMGILPYSGVAFFTYESLRNHFCFDETTNKLEKPTMAQKIFFGATAGFLGQTSSYPLDIIRRLIQTDGVTNNGSGVYRFTGIRSVAIYIWHNGRVIRGFYKGLSINWIKGPIASSISFTIFDTLKYFFI